MIELIPPEDFAIQWDAHWRGDPKAVSLRPPPFFGSSQFVASILTGGNAVGVAKHWLGQAAEHPLCVLQIDGVKTLGKPAVDGGEQIACFCPPALLVPQSGERRRGA